MMKTHIVILLTTLFLSTAFVSQSLQESPELKEATELTEQVAKLLNERKADEAVPLAKRALQIREKLLPPTDVKLSISLNYLGTAYIMKGDYGDAIKSLERLLKTLEERHGPEDANLLPTLNRLASLYNHEDNVRKTEETYLRVLALREKVNGAESVGVAETTYALGQLYRLRGDYDDALSNYKRSLMIYGRLSGSNTPEFERVSKGLYCWGYESKKSDPFAMFDQIRRELDLPRSWSPHIENLNARAINLVQPELPSEAKGQHLGGMVYIWVEIDDDGKVTSATDMCQGSPYLSLAAVKAAMKSRFRASKITIDGVPVKIKGIIAYRFRW